MRDGLPSALHLARTYTDTAEAKPCHVCKHPWSDHDMMGDCHRPDRRTRTGLCNCAEKIDRQ